MLPQATYAIYFAPAKPPPFPAGFSTYSWPPRYLHTSHSIRSFYYAHRLHRRRRQKRSGILKLNRCPIPLTVSCLLRKSTCFGPSFVCGSAVIVTNSLLGLPLSEQVQATDSVFQSNRVKGQSPQDVFVVVLMSLGFQEMSSANAGLNMSGAVAVL